jgi:hypothetical protein
MLNEKESFFLYGSMCEEEDKQERNEWVSPLSYQRGIVVII